MAGIYARRVSRPGAVPAGEGWLESARWGTRARRLGPLRYSDLGRRRLSPVADGDAASVAGWIATAAERWWAEAGHPDPYTLVVVSGDDGHLASRILAAVTPGCAAALRYVLVDPDGAAAGPPPGLAQLVRLEEPAYLYPAAPRPPRPGGGGDGTGDSADDEDADDDERPPARRIGPLATYLTEVPVLGEAPGAVVALAVLSRLPYELYELTGDEWREVRLAATEEGLVEITVPGSVPPPDAVDGGRAPARWCRLTGAADWLRRQLTAAETGTLAVIDHWGEPGDADSLSLGQLRHVREPLDGAPQPVAGTSLAVVRWRLG